jgi:uncharacterized protein (TIGR00251 family)
MQLRVRVVPRSRKAEVIDLGNNRLRVRVVSPPAEGRANDELIGLLARHYKKSKSSIIIKKGVKSRDKFVEIIDD